MKYVSVSHNHVWIREGAVRGAEMRAQHVVPCVTMATAVSMPKITIYTYTHSNLITKKKRQSVATPAVTLIKRGNLCFVTAARKLPKKECLGKSTGDVLCAV